MASRLPMAPRSSAVRSPEPRVKVLGRRAETRPIAGTYPRGSNEEEDRSLAVDRDRAGVEEEVCDADRDELGGTDGE